MKFSCLLAILSLLSACATSQPASQPSSRSTVGAAPSYRSYSWTEMQGAVSLLGRKRVVADIDEQMSARGWRESVDADVALVAKVTERKSQSTNRFYSQGASSGWGLRPFSDGRVDAVNPPTTTVKIEEFGILTLDLIDVRTHHLVWRGKTEVAISNSSRKLDAAIDAGVKRLFSSFPLKMDSAGRRPG